MYALFRLCEFVYHYCFFFFCWSTLLIDSAKRHNHERYELRGECRPYTNHGLKFSVYDIWYLNMIWMEFPFDSPLHWHCPFWVVIASFRHFYGVICCSSIEQTRVLSHCQLPFEWLHCCNFMWLIWLKETHHIEIWIPVIKWLSYLNYKLFSRIDARFCLFGKVIKVGWRDAGIRNLSNYLFWGILVGASKHTSNFAHRTTKSHAANILNTIFCPIYFRNYFISRSWIKAYKSISFI